MPRMDKKHKQLLKEQREELLDININDGVVDHLLEVRIISSDERDEIHQQRTPEERSMALLDVLPRKGSEAFRELLVALRGDGVCRRHRELADLLDPPASANSGSNSSSSKMATSTSGSVPVKPAAAKTTTAKPTTAKPTADAKQLAAGSHSHLLEPPAPASSGSSSSKKATSTSGSEPVKSATAKPTAAKRTPDAKKPVAESQPVSSSDAVQRRSIDSGKNLPSDLGICPKCAMGELMLRKDVGSSGTCYKIGCLAFGTCNAFIAFPEFVRVASPAQKCKCGRIKVELRFKRGKAPEEMKQGYKGCIDGNCDLSIVMQRSGWTIPKSVGDDGSTGRQMGSAMSFTGNEGATSPATQPAGTRSGTMDAPHPSWQCDCGRPAIRLQVKKESPNHGRWFHKCATEKCKLWLWEDEHLSDLRTPSAASTSVRQSLSSGSGSVKASGRGPKRSRQEMNGGGGDGDSTPKRKPPTCSVCKKPGHTKLACPERSAQ